jgi:DNA-binding NtrC family response regulator
MSEIRGTIDDTPRSGRRGDDGAVEPQLFLALECDRLVAGGARYSLAAANRVVIGRGTERGAERTFHGNRREVRIHVPSQSMSANHACLVRNGGSWTLEDLHSRNGSYVNGERVTAHTLRDGDVLEVGRTFFIMRTGLTVPAGAPADVDAEQLRPLQPGLATLLPQDAHHLATFSRIASSDVSLLLLGETGTGKELLARAAHAISQRQGRFIAVNCGALSPSLVESQLFGHVRGSFSGATSDSLGFIRAADRGTLFLDEIGDLAPPAQAALLRTIEEAEVVPVGAAHPIKVDVRIVAATHKPIAQTADERFRTDLLARIAGYTHKLVPLAQRLEDIGLLAAQMLGGLGLAEKTPRISPGAARALLGHSWPMNIRELRQALKTAGLLATHGVIETPMLPPSITTRSKPTMSTKPREPSPSKRRQLSEDEERLRALLISHLEECQGNITAVARRMGKASTQVHRWLKRFELNANHFRG